MGKYRSSSSKNTKRMGIIVAAFFGFILLSSTVFIAANPFAIFNDAPTADQVTVTNSPMDNYPDMSRPQFCGVSEPSANAYVVEYGVPTPCTQPVAILVDPAGTVWFVGSNTGDVASFNPVTEIVTEYENPHWNDGSPSMIWDLEYADGYLWYADELHKSVWRFDTTSKEYTQFEVDFASNSLPQLVRVHNDNIIINDFLGNTLVVLDASDAASGLVYHSIPSNVTGAVTAGFDIDTDGTVWYTTWVPNGKGLLVNIDPDLIKGINPTPPQIFELPEGLRTPNGLKIDRSGTIWLADTSSSYFFSFDPISGEFTNYVTSQPDVLSYGNATGVIQTPVSRPYWIDLTNDGKIVFNEQTANRIAVFDTQTEQLIEYSIPSRNPFWSDCGGMASCGIAQALGIYSHGNEVWFTEWAENHIGVVDTASSLPLDVRLDVDRLTLIAGESTTVSYTTIPNTDRPIPIEPIIVHTHTSVVPTLFMNAGIQVLEGANTVPVEISSELWANPGTYKILLGAKSGTVSVSEFLTVEILPAPQ